MMIPDDEEFRVPVPTRFQPEFRLYRRLWLAQVDLEEAKAAVDEILRLRIPIPRNDRPPPFLLSLTTALVVAYARPWVHSRGQVVAERTAPGSLLKTLTSKQRELHGGETGQVSGGKRKGVKSRQYSKYVYWQDLNIPL